MYIILLRERSQWTVKQLHKSERLASMARVIEWLDTGDGGTSLLKKAGAGIMQVLYGLDSILEMMAGRGTISPMAVAEGVE